jgi:hypothetical protein
MNLVPSARDVLAAGYVRPPVVGLVVAGAILSAAMAGCSAAQSGTAAVQPRHSAAVVSEAKAAASLSPAATHPPTPCQTSELSVSPGSQGTRSGLKIGTFVLTDTGAQACTITGAPQITPQGPLAGQTGMEASLAVSQLPLSLPSADDVATGGGILLQHGQKADFEIGWYSSSTVVCEASDGFGFDAPGDGTRTGALQVSFPIGSMCNGLFFVSPVYSPDSASTPGLS